MSPAHVIIGMLVVGLIDLNAGTASGQDYPTKPIRLVTGGVGGTTDAIARLVATGISGPLGQQVVVENRGGGFNQGETTVKSPPDGYTLLLSGTGLLIEALLLKPPYDLVRDFLPITLASRAPFVLVVTPTLPVKSVKELIALAKARPGELNNSVGGIGGGPHLAGELFKSLAGVNIMTVPYRSSSQEFADLITGQVQLTFTGPASIIDLIKLGKVRALAVGTTTSSALLPGLPTMAASGVPGYEAVTVYGMFAPAKTPAPIITRVNREVVRFLQGTDIKERFIAIGMEAVGTTSEEFADYIRSELARLGKLIKAQGIKAE